MTHETITTGREKGKNNDFMKEDEGYLEAYRVGTSLSLSDGSLFYVRNINQVLSKARNEAKRKHLNFKEFVKFKKYLSPVN